MRPALNYSIDRLPPCSEEAEVGVLGCILLDPVTCLPRVIEALGAGTDAFYNLRNQTIYQSFQEMSEAGKPINVESVVSYLRENQHIDEAGGMFYVAQLQDAAPSAGNLEYWLPVVQDKFTLRRLIQTCTEVVARTYEPVEDVNQLVDEVERDILRVRRVDKSGFSAMDELIPNAITTMEEYHQRQGALRGLSTGLIDLDKMTGGLMPGDMIVIAARPSVGKTSLAMNIAEHVGIDEGKGVGIFSMEMSKESLALRSLCSRARVNARDVRDGFLAERDFPKITAAAAKLHKAPIYVADVVGLTIMELRARARRMFQQKNIQLLIVDYLQLLTATNSRGRQQDNRQQELSEISRGIKQLAKELNIPVIALSQLNRDMEKNKGRKPMLSDLRESGAIEQDADVVCLMYRKEVDDEEDTGTNCVNLIIAKQRNGPTGEIPLLFIRGYTRFEVAARVTDNDM